MTTLTHNQYIHMLRLQMAQNSPQQAPAAPRRANVRKVVQTPAAAPAPSKEAKPGTPEFEEIYTALESACKLAGGSVSRTPAAAEKVMFINPKRILIDIHEGKRESDVAIIRACGETLPVKEKSLKAFLKLCTDLVNLKMEITDKAVIFYHTYNGARYTGKCTLNFFPVSSGARTEFITL